MNPGETTATPGREARIVARRKRIEERIGAKAEGDGEYGVCVQKVRVYIARPAAAVHLV